MLELDIEGLSSSGDGIGRLQDGRVVFVSRALPGDRVRVRLAEMRKRVQYADLLEVLAPSSERVDSACKVERCGGCPLRALGLEAQGRLKRQRVAENLRRIGHLDVEDLLGPIIQVGDGWHYRHRVRLQAVWIDGHWQLGYFARRSHRLVPLIQCPVLWPELEKAALGVTQALRTLPQSALVEAVELVCTRRDGRTAMQLTSSGSVETCRPVLGALLDVVSGVDIEAGAARLRQGNLELRYDHQHAGEYDLRFEPGVFTQAFPELNDRLVDAVLSTLRLRPGARILELHAGIGNFSVPLSRAGYAVTAVERNRRAAVLCQRNARSAGCDIEVSAASDTEALGGVHEYDAVLLDPPRTGAREVVQHLADHGPPRIAYVSCDSATLARDAALLVQSGYRLVSIDAFDMFPQTPHVETLAVLER